MKAAGLTILVVAAVLAADAGSSARADQDPAPAATAKEGAARKSSSDQWGDGRAATDPSDRPAQGVPYNWRQMGFGAIIIALMLAFVIWLVRRQTRTR